MNLTEIRDVSLFNLYISILLGWQRKLVSLVSLVGPWLEMRLQK